MAHKLEILDTEHQSDVDEYMVWAGPIMTIVCFLAALYFREVVLFGRGTVLTLRRFPSSARRAFALIFSVAKVGRDIFVKLINQC